ncbi:MAG: hypothetical protein NXI20_01720 [bacterium]|nr:hypothetical protein [bacterium]
MFGLFNKREKDSKPSEKSFKTIICIPGTWANRTELVNSIVSTTNGEWIFAGMVLLNTKTKETFELEIQDFDSRMRESFELAGIMNKVSDDFLNKIHDHKSVVYLLAETASLEKAKSISHATKVLLESGGIGVKVETAGKAFEANHWIELVNNFELGNLYDMFVVDNLTQPDGTVFTCGMHNLGLFDSIISGEDFSNAYKTVSILGRYQVIEGAQIGENQTFQTDLESPIFVINEEPNQPYDGDDIFGNPFGMWRLTKK